MPNLKSTEFYFILEYLREKRGLNFLGNRSSMLERRIKKRLSITGNHSYREYFDCLQQNDGELTALIDTLTINVSEFFRDSFVFDYIREKVFPVLIFKKISQQEKALRIWSAGCAAGEEPYTIALLLHEYFEKETQSIDISIFATDIDRNCLEKAQQAKFNVKKYRT